MRRYHVASTLCDVIFTSCNRWGVVAFIVTPWAVCSNVFNPFWNAYHLLNGIYPNSVDPYQTHAASYKGMQLAGISQKQKDELFIYILCHGTQKVAGKYIIPLEILSVHSSVRQRFVSVLKLKQGFEDIKHFSCWTQLSMRFQMLISIKISRNSAFFWLR